MTAEQARELCRAWFLQTLDSLKVERRMREAVRLREGVLEIQADRYRLDSFDEIRAVAFGKAAVEMTAALSPILTDAPLRGIVVAPGFPQTPLPGFRYFAGGHPYPNEQSWLAAEAVWEFLGNLSPNTLVLFLISGGGSALLEMPLDRSVSLDDIRGFHEALVNCGASIQQMNTLRKHCSAIKGGRLAERAAPATQITLYVSDVPEDLPSAVASGPTLPDETNVADCRRIAARYNLLDRFPPSICKLLEWESLPETPKSGHPCFAKSRYYCLLSNRDGVEKLLELARAEGIFAEADNRCDDWELPPAADYLLGRLESLRQRHPGRPVTLISGGELSCAVRGTGIGGRNQAFVLDCVSKVEGQSLVVLSAGTDGIDGNSPAAGAIADGATAERARKLGMDPKEYLQRSDSYSFFAKLGDAMVTGPTGTNVRDLRILLAYPD